MTANVLRALEFGIITEEQAARRLRLSVDALSAELARRDRDQLEE